MIIFLQYHSAAQSLGRSMTQLASQALNHLFTRPLSHRHLVTQSLGQLVTWPLLVTPPLRLCSFELISHNQPYFFSHGTLFFSHNKSALQISRSSNKSCRTGPSAATEEEGRTRAIGAMGWQRMGREATEWIRFLVLLIYARVLGLGLDIQYSGSCIIYRGI